MPEYPGVPGYSKMKGGQSCKGIHFVIRAPVTPSYVCVKKENDTGGISKRQRRAEAILVGCHSDGTVRKQDECITGWHSFCGVIQSC